LLVYAKAAQDNIPGHLLKAVREEIFSPFAFGHMLYLHIEPRP